MSRQIAPTFKQHAFELISLIDMRESLRFLLPAESECRFKRLHVRSTKYFTARRSNPRPPYMWNQIPTTLNFPNNKCLPLGNIRNSKCPNDAQGGGMLHLCFDQRITIILSFRLEFLSVFYIYKHRFKSDLVAENSQSN